MGAGQLEDGEVLNFSRVLGPQEVRYSFNYHRAEGDPERYKSFVRGLIAKAQGHSEKLLKSLYGYDSHEVIGFVVGTEHEGNGDDTETTH
jgi:hypothetical protein